MLPRVGFDHFGAIQLTGNGSKHVQSIHPKPIWFILILPCEWGRCLHPWTSSYFGVKRGYWSLTQSDHVGPGHNRQTIADVISNTANIWCFHIDHFLVDLVSGQMISSFRPCGVNLNFRTNRNRLSSTLQWVGRCDHFSTLTLGGLMGHDLFHIFHQQIFAHSIAVKPMANLRHFRHLPWHMPILAMESMDQRARAL